MKYKTKSHTLFFILHSSSFILLAFILLLGITKCDRFRSPVYHGSIPDVKEIGEIKSLAMIPAFDAKAGAQGSVVCPVCNDVVLGNPPPLGVSEELSRRLHKCLSEDRSFKIMPPSEARSALAATEKDAMLFTNLLSELKANAP